MSCKDSTKLDSKSLVEILSKNPYSGHNFLDLKMSEILNGKVEWEYETDPLEATVFKSEDGTIHLYGLNSSKASNLLQKFVAHFSTLTTGSVFTTEFLEATVKALDPSIHRSFQFDYFALSPASIVGSMHEVYRFRSLDFQLDTDQELLTRWYTAYNKEMNSNWEIPILSLSNSKNYIVMEDPSTARAIGFVGLSLESLDRLWFGRLYILPELRGQGFSKIILNYLKKIAEQKNKLLCLLVHEDNLIAIKLYLAEGFKFIDKIVVLSRG